MLHEWGDAAAPTVVCLHGITSHGARYRRVAERLAGRFHVVAPDLRGHGRSGWEPPWTIEQHLDDLLETVPPDACLWVGHSFGGRLVLELAFAHPERVERGVLLDPAIWVPPDYAHERAEAGRALRSWASVAEAVEARFADGSLFGAPRDLVAEDYREHLDAGADGRLRLRYSPSAVIGAWGEMARTPPHRPLEVPLLVVRALQAEVCPEVLVEAYRGSVGELLEEATVPGGHIVMWDALEETIAAIERFLDTAAERAPAA